MGGYDSYIDKAEVPVDKADKERLVELMNEVTGILDKYPYSLDHSVHYVTAMSRAKSAVSEAAQWCSYLHVKDCEVH